MKSHRQELWFNIPARRGFVNITREVADAIRASAVQEGLVLVNAMHITASVFINDDESGLHADYEKWLEGLAPHAPTSQYLHNCTGEHNADAHLKRQVMGRDAQRSWPSPTASSTWAPEVHTAKHRLWRCEGRLEKGKVAHSFCSACLLDKPCV
jgi:secondary thiamine-phosphate synthase enzyme